MRFEAEVIVIDGCLPDFLGASCSDRVFYASIVSMSMLVFLRGAKNLRINTSFGGSLTAVDVGTDLVHSLAVCDVSLELCFLCFYNSRKSLSCAIGSNEVLLAAPLCPAYALIIRTAFISFSVTVYMP
jgi:hypothetical protein